MRRRRASVAIKGRRQESYERAGTDGKGAICYHRFWSKSLEIEKAFHVYLPPGFGQSDDRYPVIYLFRGSEREWVNPLEDASRVDRTVADVMDELIGSGQIGPLILVMPSTVSENETPCLGVNLVAPSGEVGMGTGRYEQYLTEDLIAEVEQLYPVRSGRNQRAVDGFSLGGYTSVLLGVKRPDLYGSVGAYDGTFMWADLMDPRVGKKGRDATWLDPAFFDSAFGKPRQIEAMLAHNASNVLRCGGTAEVARWREMSWIIRSGGDERAGNVDRAYHLVGELNRLDISNSTERIELDSVATHTWGWADQHLRESAVIHWRHFCRHEGDGESD